MRIILKDTIKYYSIFAMVGIIAVSVHILGIDIMLCRFKAIFSIPCPGCGLTRAFLSLLRGDLLTALSKHPLFWMVPFVPIILGLKNNKIPSIVIGALFLLVWVYRIITTYPNFY